MNYKRTCKDCGESIRYSDLDEFIICPNCGRKVRNPHYQEIELLDDDDLVEETPATKAPSKKKAKLSKNALISIIASVSAAVLIGLIVLVVFAIPFEVSVDDAKVAYAEVIKETNKLTSGTYILEETYYNNKGEKETASVYLAYQEDKGMYYGVDSGSYSIEAFADLKEEMVYYTSVSQDGRISRQKSSFDREDFDKQLSKSKNEVFSETVLTNLQKGGLWDAYVNGYKQWGNTVLEFSEAGVDAKIVLGSKYLKKIEMSYTQNKQTATITMEFTKSYKPKKIDKSAFEIK